eukprot:SAG11_NODE_1684_length_4449_cov_7.642299_3_plen_59_part_00
MRETKVRVSEALECRRNARTGVTLLGFELSTVVSSAVCTHQAEVALHMCARCACECKG